MLNKINLKIILIFIFLIFGVMVKNLMGGVLTSRYYKNEFKRPYFHLIIGFGKGLSYYFNYSGNNRFSPFNFILELENETEVKHFGGLLRLEISTENKERTDEIIYYNYYRRINLGIYVGLNYKFRSFIPYVDCIIPYFTLGIGHSDIKVENTFKLSGKREDINIESGGEILGIDLGSNFVIIENLFSINFGFKYNWCIINRYKIYGEGFHTDESKERYEYFSTGYIAIKFFVF